MREINNSLEVLKKGNIILYPTDTVWGLGCDATNFKAVSQIYRIKNRTESKSLIVLVSSIHMLKKYVTVPSKALDILKKAKKPTTIIYKNPEGFAKNTIALDGTIAVRVVKDEFCRKLIKRFKKPIISSSANVSGQDTPKSFKEISQSILDDVNYVVNLHQNKENSKPSAIFKIVDSQIEVLRS